MWHVVLVVRTVGPGTDRLMSEQGQWFQCALCRELFIRARPETEVLEEYINEFPGDTGPVSTVCSDCYRILMAWRAEQEAQNE